MSKKFDFSNITLKVIDISMNSAPDLYVNQNNITFSKRALEDMGYPAYVQYCIDAEHAIFAVRACKGTESRAVPFVKSQTDQLKTLSCGSKAIHDVITHLIPDHKAKKRYKVEGYYDSEKKIMYYDLSEAVVSMYYKEEKEYYDKIISRIGELIKKIDDKDRHIPVIYRLEKDYKEITAESGYIIDNTKINEN